MNDFYSISVDGRVKGYGLSYDDARMWASYLIDCGAENVEIIRDDHEEEEWGYLTW